MSVINRMLSDLERRGAPGARKLHAPGGRVAARRPGGASRARRWLGRAAPLVLLAALIAVAAGLWRERAPDVLAMMTAAPPTRSEPTQSEPGQSEPRQSALAQTAMAQAPAGAVEQPPPAGADEVETDAAAVPTATEQHAAAQNQPTQAERRVDKVAGAAEVDAGSRGEAEAASSVSGRTQGTQKDRAEAESRASASDTNRSPDPTPARVEQAEAEAQTTASFGTGTERRSITRAERSGDGSSHASTGKAEQGQVRKSAPEPTPSDRARARERAARQALQAGDRTRARRLLRQVLALDPARHEARDLLVTLALRAGEQETARNLLAKGLEQARGRPGFAKPYARLLVDAGALKQALAVLQPAAQAAANDAGYHGLVAAIAQRLDRNKLAARQYTRALQLDDGRGIWWLGLGIALAAEDHPREARAAFEKARASGDLNQRLQQWVERRIDDLS